VTPPRYLIRAWWRRRQVRFLLRHNTLCTYCLCEMNRTPGDARQLTVDHWVPRSAGGSNRLANLVLACATCNRRKGSRSAFEYLASPELFARMLTIAQEKIAREPASRG